MNTVLDRHVAAASQAAEVGSSDLTDSGSPARFAAEAQTNDDELPVTIIGQGARRSASSGVADLWRHRGLLFLFVWRDLKARYKQTCLGGALTIVQPFCTMVVFSIFLGMMAGMNAGIEHYPLYVFCGLLPWTFLSRAIHGASGSVLGNQHLVTKIYFPRLIIPLSTVVGALVDFAVGFGLLLLMMLWFGVAPGGGLLLAAAIILILALASFGIGTLLGAITVAYRDLYSLLGFVIQLWMFSTPTIFMKAEAMVGPNAQKWLPLNPAYGLIYNFRQAVLGQTLNLYALWVSSAVSLALVVLGWWCFRRMEQKFADII